MILITLALSLLSFVLTFVFLKHWIPLAKEKGICGLDVHKVKKQYVTEAGGTIFLLSIVICLLTYGLWSNGQKNSDYRFFAILSSVLIAGLLGLQDQLVGLKWRQKILLPFIISLPLIIAKVGSTTVDLPFLGIIDLGNIYTFFLLPLAVTGLVNMFNMYAGYNGLEAGLGAVNAFWFLIVSYLTGNQLTFFISAVLLTSLLAFLKYNWCPAKVFPGDIGTFTIGTLMVSMATVGNMEKFALGLFSPYIINFLLLVYWLKLTNRPFKKFASVDKEGYLKPPVPFATYWILPYYFKLKEKTTVKILISIQFLVGLMSFLLFVKI
jgi:UDP-N-acetylglucosamine--dolichyl-phosphate N-acetylglucosaminephosphotransferase